MKPLLALLLTTSCLIAVAAAACGGSSSSDLPALATKAAGTEASASISVVAKGLKFNTNTIVVPASEQITLTFDNEDSGAVHNFAVYDGKDAKQNLFRGDLITGKDTQDYSFQAPAAGIYYFRCDAHPDMNGVFIVK